MAQYFDIKKLIKNVQDMGTKELAKVVLLVAAVVFFLLGPTFLNPYHLHLLIAIFFYATLAAAWDIISGYTGQFSFAHASLAAFSAYSFGLIAIHFGLSPIHAYLAAIALTTVVGTLIGILCLRMKGIYLSLTTLAFAEIFNHFVLNEFALTHGTEGLQVPLLFGTMEKLPYYFLGLAILVSTILIKFRLENSEMGLRFLAIREDEYAAEIHGVNTTKEKVLAFTLSSFLSAVAGGFLIGYIGRITPKTMDLRLMFRVVVMSYVGGTASVPGPIIGAFLMRIIEEYARAFESAHLIIWGVILIGVFFFMPDGIWGKAKESLSKLKKFWTELE